MIFSCFRFSRVAAASEPASARDRRGARAAGLADAAADAPEALTAAASFADAFADAPAASAGATTAGGGGASSSASSASFFERAADALSFTAAFLPDMGGARVASRRIPPPVGGE